MSLFQWELCCQPSFMQDCGRSLVGLPRNTVLCTLEQLFNLGQLLVGVLESEDFVRLWLNFEAAASQSIKEPLPHAHKSDLGLLPPGEGGDPFFPQQAEFPSSYLLQAVSNVLCFSIWRQIIKLGLGRKHLFDIFLLSSIKIYLLLSGRNHFNPLGIRGHTK